MSATTRMSFATTVHNRTSTHSRATATSVGRLDNAASDDWHTTHATNDLRVGGTFGSRMEAKDASMGFDFEGVYTDLTPLQHIAYALADGRTVSVRFAAAHTDPATSIVTETFLPENENPLELQYMGWQAILNRFKQYTEQM